MQYFLRVDQANSLSTILVACCCCCSPAPLLFKTHQTTNAWGTFRMGLCSSAESPVTLFCEFRRYSILRDTDAFGLGPCPCHGTSISGISRSASPFADLLSVLKPNPIVRESCDFPVGFSLKQTKTRFPPPPPPTKNTKEAKRPHVTSRLSARVDAASSARLA